MIKDILAFANEGVLAEESFSLPLALARKFGARLSAVHVMPEPYVYVPVEPGAASGGIVEAAIDEARRVAGENETRFKSYQQRRSLEGVWHTANFWDEAVSLAYRHDLLVTRQRNSVLPEFISDQGPEYIATAMGRPTLVVPDKGHFESCGRNVLIAWKPTREATRAVHDALQLFEPGATVTVLEVDPPSKVQTVDDMAAHIARHGFAAKAVTAKSDSASISKVILDHTASLRADLIVMGAYSHSRLRELIIGGVTKSMLQDMTVPLLMSH